MIIKGTLLRIKLHVGSKSEHFGFVLKQDNGLEMIVYKNGDNPFQHESLIPFENKIVCLDGEMDNSKFIIDAINEE